MSIEDQIHDLHENLLVQILGNGARDSGTLHHYTTLESGMKILSSNKLRFTNIKFLNDPSELSHGLNIAKKVLPNLFKKHLSQNDYASASFIAILYKSIVVNLSSDSQKQELWDNFKNMADSSLATILNEVMSYEKLNKKPSFYISCLSESQDDLRQWIPYADNCRGMAIGFRGVEGNYHHISNSDIWIVPVCYKSIEEKSNFLEQFIEKSIFLANTNFSNSNNKLASLMPTILNLLAVDLVACKNPHYSDEKEWRLFFTQENSNPEFMVKNHIIKPYIDIEYNFNSVQDIRLGRLLDFELNKEALDLMIGNKTSSLLKPTITHSQIDYRG